MTGSNEFFFTVPEGSDKGTVFRLTAPDQKVLQLPLPREALPGDQIFLEKKDGNWSFKHVLRPGATVKTPEMVDQDLHGPDVIKVRFETTKGPLILRLVPHWSPNGVRRLLEMVDNGFFKDVCIYRGIPKFLMQFGVVKDEKRKCGYDPIMDDPLCGVPYLEGMVGFAASGPNTRTQQLCLFLGAAPFLGKNSMETPLGRVCSESLSTLGKIFLPGDIPQCGGVGPDPMTLADLGNAYISKSFPKCDFITGASRAP